jgi:hypothetical protein
MPAPPDVFACREVADRLEAFVDGDLDLDAAAALEAHLAGCAACREQHRLAAAVRDGLRGLPELDTPEHVLAAVRRATAAERIRSSGPAPRWAWRTAAAAALAVAAASGVLWWHGAHQPQPAPTQYQVAEAAAEARLALRYVADFSRRAGIEATRQVLVSNFLEPALRSVGRGAPSTTQPPATSPVAGQPALPTRDQPHPDGGSS